MEEKQFTTEEMTEISKLQTRYQNAIFQLGELEIREQAVNEELSAIKDGKKKLKDAYREVQKDESQLLKDLTDKYGEGSLNIKTGTFTPAEKPE